MSYATYLYADMFVPYGSIAYRGKLRKAMHGISYPLKDSIETIASRVPNVPKTKIMLFTAAVMLYEDGVKKFTEHAIFQTVYRNLTNESPFDLHFKMSNNFENLLTEEAFVLVEKVNRRYALNAAVQEKLDAIIAGQKKS